MFLSYFADRTRPALGLLGQSLQATFQPVKTGSAIAIGSREDFDRRLTFFLAVAGLQLAVQTLFAAWLGVSVMPSRIDAVWQYVQPFLMGGMFMLLFLPIRLLGWTKLKFSEYFQAAAMSMGPALVQLPLTLIPAYLAVQAYGLPDAADPRVQEILAQPGGEALNYCLPKFESLICLASFAAIAPDTAWSATLNTLLSFVLVVPIMLLIRAATAIAVWKQIVSFVIVVLIVYVGLYVGLVSLKPA